MKKIYLLVFAICLYTMVQGQQNDSVRLFVDSALNIMQRHSMYSKNVNWKKVRAKTFSLAAKAASYAEATPAIQFAFNQLNDKHGWLVLNKTKYTNPNFKPDTGRINANMKAAALKGPQVYAKRLGQYAYISTPFFGGQSTDKMNAFAQRIQDSLCRVADRNTKGIILDLRLNAGGNFFPMMIGLSNVYGKQHLNTNQDGSWNYTDHSVKLQDTIVVKLSKNCGDYNHLPVAVLTGPITGSSGEFMAIAFVTRKKTRLFGEKTAGFTTANNGFLLPGTGNGIVLSESAGKDGNGKMYKDGITPASIIIGGDDFFNHANDKKVQAALEWLRKFN